MFRRPQRLTGEVTAAPPQAFIGVSVPKTLIGGVRFANAPLRIWSRPIPGFAAEYQRWHIDPDQNNSWLLGQ